MLEEAIAANVHAMAITGTDIEASQTALSLCQAHPQSLIATAGVHPHYAKDVSEHWRDDLRALAAQPQIRAIGECGLDFNRNFSPPDIQLAVFEQQLQLAVELKLPVFLHERDAFDEQVALLERYRPDLIGGVAHCFTGNIDQLRRYVDLDLYVGITGWVCDPKRGDALREAVTALPLSHVLLETDAPYLLPKTLKSKSRNNAPKHLPHIGQHLAELMQVDSEVLLRASWENAVSLFQGAPGAV